MALIKCPECGREISDTNEKCMYCGYLVKRKTFNVETIIRLSLLAVFVIMVIVIAVNINSKKSEKNYEYDDYDYSSSYNSYESKYDVEDDISFSNWSISNGKINDTVYVEIKNNSNKKLRGSATAYIYNNGQVVQSAAVLFPNSGISPGDTVNAHGIFNTVNGRYDNVKFEVNYTYEAN